MASFIKLLATFIYNNEHVRRIDANKAKWKIKGWNFCYSNLSTYFHQRNLVYILLKHQFEGKLNFIGKHKGKKKKKIL